MIKKKKVERKDTSQDKQTKFITETELNEEKQRNAARFNEINSQLVDAQKKIDNSTRDIDKLVYAFTNINKALDDIEEKARESEQQVQSSSYKNHLGQFLTLSLAVNGIGIIIITILLTIIFT